MTASFRRVTTPSGREVILGQTGDRRSGAKHPTYNGIHKATGDRLTIHKVDAGWVVFAWPPKDSPNRQYDEGGGRVTLASGLSTLSAAAEYSK